MKTQWTLNGVTLLLAMLALLMAFVAWAEPQAGIQAQDAPQPAAPAEALVLGTAFTYQGYLEDEAGPANGLYEFQFAPFDHQSAGTARANSITRTVNVTDGQFSTQLDFGNNVFNGQRLWLQIGVRRAGATEWFTTLTPRQELTPAPYALFAVNIPYHDHFGAGWSGSGVTGIAVNNLSTTGSVGAVSGYVHSTNGHAVLGEALSPTGQGIGVYGATNSPQGFGGYFKNYTAGYALYAEGDVKQSPTGDGLVKAAAVATVGGFNPALPRYFNTITEQVTIWACGLPQYATGHSCIDFNFTLNNRYWVATSLDGGYVSCSLWLSGESDTLNCWHYNNSGQLVNGEIMVVVY